MIEDKVIQYIDGITINYANDSDIMVYIHIDTFLKAYDIEKINNINVFPPYFLDKLEKDFDFSNYPVTFALIEPVKNMEKGKLAIKVYPPRDFNHDYETFEQMHHAIIKKRTYLDGITIEVVDNRNASAVVPKATIIQIMRSRSCLPSYLKSPLRLIYERLEKDFNFHNMNHLKYHYWENDEGLFYNFHRQ